MVAVNFYLGFCAILGIADADASSLQASPLGYNASSKSISTSSRTFPGHEFSSINSMRSPPALNALNSTFNNDTEITNALSSSTCCFVVQDTIDVMYWADYLTFTTVVSHPVTSLITFATHYVDTTVTTNVSTVIRTLNHTSTMESAGTPTIPNTNFYAPGLSLTQIGLNGSIATTFGATVTYPTQFYVFPSVNVIKVPAVFEKDGRPACATTSTFPATCPGEGADAETGSITGINSNAESYFNSYVNLSPKQGSATISISHDVVQVSFSKPFVYAPLSGHFVNENLGYVPQALINWMAQDSEYVSKIPGIASCLPGGPSLDLVGYGCPHLTFGGTWGLFGVLLREHELTVKTTVTVAGKGCFHPGACPSPATPGATAVAATPEVTPEAEGLRQAGAFGAVQTQDASSPAGSKKPLPPQAPSHPLPAPVETPASTLVVSPERQAANVPPSPLSNGPSPSPPGAVNQPPSAPTDSSENPSVNSPENVPEAKPPPNNPAKPPSHFQGLGAIIAGAIGFTPTSPPNSPEIQLSPGPTPTLSYSISIAPSASVIVINGVTSILPASGPEGDLGVGVVPIAVGSQQISQNAASEYVVAGQMLASGAPPISVQGTEVSLAPSASAIVVAGSTIILSSTGTPAFTVGAGIVTANSASQYVVGGQTLTPGGPAVTVSGTRISLAASGTQVVVGSSTIGLASTFTPPPLPPLTIGSQIFTANSASDYIIDGQTLIPGALTMTVSGTPISLAPGATQVVIGSSTIDLEPTTTPPPLTFGSQTFTANSLFDYIIDGQTLIPGAPAITVSNTPISLALDASQVVIGSSTETLHPNPTLPPIVIGSQTFTANNAGAYVIGSQTLTPGASGIVIPGSLLAPTSSLSVLTVAGQVFTANPTGFSIDGTTISAGGPGVVISGTPISLQASGVLDVGNSTITLASATVTNGRGVTAFTGEGDRMALRLLYSLLAWVITIVIIAAV